MVSCSAPLTTVAIFPSSAWLGARVRSGPPTIGVSSASSIVSSIVSASRCAVGKATQETPIDESEVTLFFDETAQKLHDQQWKQLANRRTTEITIEHQLVEHIGAEWAYEAQLP